MIFSLIEFILGIVFHPVFFTAIHLIVVASVAKIAGDLKRNPLAWGLIAFLSSVVGLAALAIAGPRKDHQ